MTDVAGTELARIAAALTPDDKRHLSGFRVLTAGDHAFNARIALARRAQKSLDAQYYLIASDTAGLQFLRALRDAAVRGVRVRLLLDDLYTAGQDELLAGSPRTTTSRCACSTRCRRAPTSLGSRVVLLAARFHAHQPAHAQQAVHRRQRVRRLRRPQHRQRILHARRRGQLHRPRRALVRAGGALECRSCSTATGTASTSIRCTASSRLRGPAAARLRFDRIVQAVPPTCRCCRATGWAAPSVESQLESGRLEQHFATAQLIADSPAKAAGIGAASIDGTAMGSTLNVMRSARFEVVDASPYFVPGSPGLR